MQKEKKMKSYTDLIQSQKLAEILPLESSDMEYLRPKETNIIIGSVPFVKDDSEVENSAYDAVYERIPCWSLTALLGVLKHPRCIQGDKPIYWFCGCFGKDELYHEVEADNPVDACYKMILELKEKELI
jgi:hypothetical protein